MSPHQEFRPVKTVYDSLTMSPVEYCKFSKQIKRAHELESMKVCCSWAYHSLGVQEMAYFSRADPVLTKGSG